MEGNRRAKTEVPIGRLDVSALAAELRRRISGEVRFDEGSRALYATDASNYRQVPIGVVIPRDKDDVVETVALARRHGAPVLARGGGTSLAGQCCNVAVIIDMTKHLNRIIDIDPERRIARVEPGVVLDDLRNAAEEFHLTFGPDPATHNHCTIGGMIGNNSCGVHSVMAGKTDDNVEEMEILTYDGLRLTVGRTSEDELGRIIGEGGPRGEIYARLKSLSDRYSDLIRERYPHIPRRVSGYNLPQLLPENGFHVARALVGSESTCVTVLEATLRLVHSPPERKLVVLGYRDIYEAADHITEILGHRPIGLEGMDRYLVDQIKRMDAYAAELALLPEGGGWLLVEFGGETSEEADDRAHDLASALRKSGSPPNIEIIENARQAEMIWKVRESGLGATARVPGEYDTWEGWEDSAVPPERLGDYLRDFRRLLNRYDYHGSLYGHFGQGCVHTRIDFDLTTREGIDRFRSFLYEAADLVVSYGGSFSGEHGDGQARGELLPKMYGDRLMEAFREFKSIWDPEWKMNPGKVVDAYRADENLRLGTGYHPAQPKTHFKFPDDNGSIARAALRCVGVGECRKTDAGTMCPSYMVTMEEKHSTRGRARLLFEMLEGDVLTGGWRDEHVKEALDLCLACKGCKRECPVDVDMATYKAEFYSHYYRARLRPRAAYSMGLIYWWSRLASRFPGVANFFTQAPLISDLAKLAGGIASERRLPAFARETFKEWFYSRPESGEGRPEVLLWPDTFNNHFHPGTARAAVEVLESAGFRVVVPQRALCCGRPLYDFGMLGLAERLLGQILSALRNEIAAGVPVVVLEPSCAAVFRDELVNLFPNDEDAKRLRSQTFTLAEFLKKESVGDRLPPLNRKALVHGHCHHKAIMTMDADEAILSGLGLDFDLLDSGCCGMAGSFGFHKGEHFEVSMKAGERVLLPSVRDAAADTLIIADGFSCREQIAQATDRRALHLAEVIRMALRDGPDGPVGDYPETYYVATGDRPRSKLGGAALAISVGLLAGGALVWMLKRRGR